MDPFAIVLITCGGAAVIGLALSLTTHWRLARRLSQVALWCALGAVPVAIGVDLVRLWLQPEGPHSGAFLLGRTISHAMNYGVLVLPCAGLAGLALRRANARRRRAD